MFSYEFLDMDTRVVADQQRLKTTALSREPAKSNGREWRMVRESPGNFVLSARLNDD